MTSGVNFIESLIFGNQTNPESQQSYQLSKINSANYSKDFVTNLVALNQGTDYMAAYMRVAQKGIDQANENIIQKIQDFISDMIIIFTGGSGTNFEWGDLLYFIQALGAMFGFVIDLSGPINLIDAAQHAIDNFFNGGIQSLIVAALRALGALLDGIPIIGDTLDDVCNAIADVINSTISTANTAQSTATSAQSTATSAQSTATAAQTTATANAAELATVQTNLINATTLISNLQVSQSGTTTGGISLHDNFPTVGLLSADPSWTVTGQDLGTGVDLYVGAAGDLGITGSPTTTGVRIGINTTPLSTDNGQAVLVAFNKGTAQSFTAALCRVAADGSKFVYANTFQDKLYLGYATWDLNPAHAPVFTDWNSGGTSIDQEAAGQLVLSWTGTNYAVTLAGQIIVQHTDAAGNHPIDSSHRRVGLLINVEHDIGGYHYGWQVASFSASDTSSPSVVGIGWTFVRSATSGVNTVNQSGTNYTLGTGTFDVQGTTVGVTVANLGTGKVTAIKPGFYSVSMCAYSGANIGASSQGGFWVTPSGGSGALSGTSIALPSTADYAVASSDVIYLNVGDSIQPAVVAGASVSITGTGTGALTHFKGCLASGAG